VQVSLLYPGAHSFGHAPRSSVTFSFILFSILNYVQ
jgi:hypothetical protein